MNKKTILLITVLAFLGLGCKKNSPLPTVVQQTTTVSESTMPEPAPMPEAKDTSAEGSAPLGATPSSVRVVPPETMTQGAVVTIME